MSHLQQVRLVQAGLAALLCSSLPSTAQARSAGAPASVALLTKADADARSAVVKNIRYDLSFAIGPAAIAFSGKEDLQFDLLSLPTKPHLRLDFQGGVLNEVLANGVKVDSSAYNGQAIAIPTSLLKVGANQITSKFTHPYSQNGNGLYRFQDPEDQLIYLYTLFEPYAANEVFPCFDQPDLKATFTTTVEAPADWQVIAPTAEKRVTTAAGSTKRWEFPASEPISTYLFSLHAGSYREWSTKAGDVPLRMFTRKSLGKYFDARGWTSYSRRILKHYQDYFALAYPFHKLDQIFVPDFNEGGMENAAAISYSERDIARGPSTLAQAQNRASLAFHEIAHQWFGDLVTMRWWNDLWLNEAFASYMDELAQQSDPLFKDGWLSLAAGKIRAYQLDDSAMTHPIEVAVDNTDQAASNFDAITYDKGAAALKQLDFYLGANQFRDGVRAYFNKYKFGNATRQDFIDALSKASQKDLGAWSNEWLLTTGANQIEVSLRCENQKVASMSLSQRGKSPENPLRHHKTVIALLRGDDLQIEQKIPVEYSAAETQVPAAIGHPCPDLVFPNFDDYDYAKVKLDERSLAMTKSKLSKVPDATLRLMLWGTLWEMVREGSWGVTDYATMLLTQIPEEKNDHVLNFVLSTIAREGSSILAYYSDDTAPGSMRTRFVQDVVQLLAKQLRLAAAGSDLQKRWYDAYVAMAAFPGAGIDLNGILSGQGVPKGLTIDQDRRWRLLGLLSATSDPNAAALQGVESAKDHSQNARLAEITAAAGSPELSAKEAWYAKVVDPNARLTQAQAEAALRGLLPLSQRSLREHFRDRYFTDLAKAASQERDPQFAEVFASQPIPASCTAASSAALATFLQTHAALPAVVQRNLKRTLEEDQRCVKVRQLIKG